MENGKKENEEERIENEIKRKKRNTPPKIK